MSRSVVVLCHDTPEAPVLVDALSAAGDDLRVASLSGGAALRLLDEDGGAVLTVEVPLLVQVAGEPARLLGPEAAGVEVPVWWVELHAGPGAAELAERVGRVLVARLGGVLCGGTGAAP